MEIIIPYVTIITAIIAAFLTYKSQLRLKTFEILYSRRTSVLDDIEAFINKLYQVETDLDINEPSDALLKHSQQDFWASHILFHKIKGANFCESSNTFADAFLSIVTEPPENTMEGYKERIKRTINTLSALYGFSHSQLTKDLEEMTFSLVVQSFRQLKNKIA